MDEEDVTSSREQYPVQWPPLNPFLYKQTFKMSCFFSQLFSPMKLRLEKKEKLSSRTLEATRCLSFFLSLAFKCLRRSQPCRGATFAAADFINKIYKGLNVNRQGGRVACLSAPRRNNNHWSFTHTSYCHLKCDNDENPVLSILKASFCTVSSLGAACVRLSEASLEKCLKIDQ